jgi:hypothetical protein
MFPRSVIGVFRVYYLKAPNEAYVARLLTIYEARCWLGILGIIDYMSSRRTSTLVIIVGA